MPTVPQIRPMAVPTLQLCGIKSACMPGCDPHGGDVPVSKELSNGVKRQCDVVELCVLVCATVTHACLIHTQLVNTLAWQCGVVVSMQFAISNDPNEP